MFGSLWRQRGPLGAAVARQLVVFERLVLRIWQILSIAGVATGLIYAVAVSRSLGLACAGTAAVFFGWFVLIGYLLDRGQMTHPLSVAATIVEALIPWIFFVVIVISNGPEYALASWVPPFLFCACLIAYIPRLDPRKPAVFGVVCAIAYPLLYLVFVRDRLPAAAEMPLIHQPATQITRGITLLASSIVTALLVMGFRLVIVTAGASPPAEQAGSGDVLGRYQRVRALGEGLFEARLGGNAQSDRRLLVEYLPGNDPRVIQAAERAAGVSHPGIASVIDVGLEGDGAVVVSELVEGASIAAILRGALTPSTPAPPQVVAHVGLALLLALDHLHRGALDRDGHSLRLVYGFDPELAVISLRGEIKLTDVWRAPLRPIPSWTTAVAPELTRGEPATERADLYAVGVALWELLAGEPRRPEHARLPISSRHPRLDRGWDAFFLSVLAPDPGLRPVSARRMAYELEALMPADVPGSREWLARTVSSVSARS